MGGAKILTLDVHSLDYPYYLHSHYTYSPHLPHRNIPAAAVPAPQPAHIAAVALNATDGPGSGGFAQPEAAGTNYPPDTPADFDHTVTVFEPGVAAAEVAAADTAAARQGSRSVRIDCTPKIDFDYDSPVA